MDNIAEKERDIVCVLNVCHDALTPCDSWMETVGVYNDLDAAKKAALELAERYEKKFPSDEYAGIDICQCIRDDGLSTFVYDACDGDVKITVEPYRLNELCDTHW